MANPGQSSVRAKANAGLFKKLNGKDGEKVERSIGSIFDMAIIR